MALAVAAILAPRHTFAGQECPRGSSGGGVSYPPDGATDVPTNTRLWRSHLGQGAVPLEELRLVEIGGDTIAIESATSIEPRLLGTPVAVFTPERELAADTVYQLWWCYADPCDRLVGEFRTGSGPAPPPELPDVEVTGRHSERAWADVALKFEYEGILVIDAGTFEPETRDGDLFWISNIFSDLRVVWCGDDPPFGYESDLRFGVYNAAGEFSGWSATTAALPSRGCAVGDTPAAPAIFVVMFLRRRRSRALG